MASVEIDIMPSFESNQYQKQNRYNMTTQTNNLQSFLLKHILKKGNPDKKEITNTRIGEKSSNGVMGGSYSISDTDYPQFLNLYNRDIITKKKSEYLTEKQLEDDGPLLVDIDLRYELDIDTRQHNSEHIQEIVDNYICILSNIYDMNENTKFKIFVMEKQNVNVLTEKNITKDGIHIIITLKVDRTTQKIIRQYMINQMNNAWEDLPIKNSWEDVFDEGITKGTTPWQLYGSKKPKHDVYKITYLYEVEYDNDEEECICNKIDVNDYIVDMNELSIRNSNHLKLEFNECNEEFLELYKKFSEKSRSPKSDNNLNKLYELVNVDSNLSDMIASNINIDNISCIDDINRLYNAFIDGLKNEDYDLRETSYYTMALPGKYYESGSYDRWIRVCWALRNTSKRLLIVWIKFSSQAKNFRCSYDELSELVEHWESAGNTYGTGLTKRSIIHWVRQENKDKYEEVHKSTISYYVDRTIYGADGINGLKSEKYEGGEVELAQVLYQIYKNDYVCTSIKGNIWYKYVNHRWKLNDSGTSLRKSISDRMRLIYNNKSVELSKQISLKIDSQNLEEGEKQKLVEKQKLIGRKIIEIIKFLNKSNDKKNIMIEAKELFYDGDFIEKLDQNPYLLCFNNGVMDFKEGIFREGRPDDYLSLTTKINYVKLSDKTKETQEEIKEFFSKLFPNEQLREYMWNHLASTLLGTADQQTFNMYIGMGQNGKSVLVTLMEQILGEYKGDVPLSLITNSRTKVGGVSPEIVQLRGIRYALMQEPKKGDTINEGIMKQLTSGEDNLQGRAPYMEKTISFKPQLKLVVTANVFMQINSNDHGTWRRIRVCPFESLFTENPVKDDPDKPYQFPLDPRLSKEKFPKWKEVFASMLIEIVKKTNGLVKDCDIVLSHSKKYRASQDYISAFVQEKITKQKNGVIEKNEINQEFKMWWAANYGQGRKEPPAKEVHEYIDRNFCKCRDGIWKNLKIKYTSKTTNIDDDDVDDINENEL